MPDLSQSATSDHRAFSVGDRVLIAGIWDVATVVSGRVENRLCDCRCDRIRVRYDDGREATPLLRLVRTFASTDYPPEFGITEIPGEGYVRLRK